MVQATRFERVLASSKHAVLPVRRRLKSGVTGWNRTSVGGFTNHGSTIELPSREWSGWQESNLLGPAPKAGDQPMNHTLLGVTVDGAVGVELNPRPVAYEATALPTELQRRCASSWMLCSRRSWSETLT